MYEFNNPISIIPAMGWVACWDCDGKIVTDPVICWALCEASKQRKLVGGKVSYEKDPVGNHVVGMVMSELGMVIASDDHNFVGYMQEGGLPESQPWWQDVLNRHVSEVHNS